MVAVLAWILLSVAVGIFATRCSRSGLGWFALSLIITPMLAGIFLAILPPLKTKSQWTAATLVIAFGMAAGGALLIFAVYQAARSPAAVFGSRDVVPVADGEGRGVLIVDDLVPARPRARRAVMVHAFETRTVFYVQATTC